MGDKDRRSSADDRAERLAAQLRANLARRRAQQREREATYRDEGLKPGLKAAKPSEDRDA